HRSTVSWQWQVAHRLEVDDPHTSVTFVWLACSGASIEHGLLNRYVENFKPGTVLAPQIDEAAQAIGRRRPDAILVSIGANDIGFGPIANFCAGIGSNIANGADSDLWVQPVGDDMCMRKVP